MVFFFINLALETPSAFWSNLPVSSLKWEEQPSFGQTGHAACRLANGEKPRHYSLYAQPEAGGCLISDWVGYGLAAEGKLVWTGPCSSLPLWFTIPSRGTEHSRWCHLCFIIIIVVRQLFGVCLAGQMGRDSSHRSPCVMNKWWRYDRKRERQIIIIKRFKYLRIINMIKLEGYYKIYRTTRLWRKRRRNALHTLRGIHHWTLYKVGWYTNRWKQEVVETRIESICAR